MVTDVHDEEAIVSHMEKCINDVRAWATRNKLKFNDSKTELFAIWSKYSNKVPDVLSISTGDITVYTGPSARNIGVMLDGKLTMFTHIS